MKKIGILGGMGPLASAKFLSLLYQKLSSHVHQDQDYPDVILRSICSMPDRTKSILSNDLQKTKNRLIVELTKLMDDEVEAIVVSCVTAFNFLDVKKFPIINPFVLISEMILQQNLSPVLLCTNGTYQSGLFQKFLSQEAMKQIKLLEKEDITTLHNFIYQLKAGSDVYQECINWLKEVASKMQTDSFIFGCTELHLIPKEIFPYKAIDPLEQIIEGIIKKDKFEYF